MTESPRQMTPSQSKIKQSTFEIKALLSSNEALRAAAVERKKEMMRSEEVCGELFVGGRCARKMSTMRSERELRWNRS